MFIHMLKSESISNLFPGRKNTKLTWFLHLSIEAVSINIILSSYLLKILCEMTISDFFYPHTHWPKIACVHVQRFTCCDLVQYRCFYTHVHLKPLTGLFLQILLQTFPDIFYKHAARQKVEIHGFVTLDCKVHILQIQWCVMFASCGLTELYTSASAIEFCHKFLCKRPSLIFPARDFGEN